MERGHRERGMTNILTLSEDRYERLQAQLRRRPACEKLGVGFLTLIESANQREFLLRDDYLPEADDYAAQSAGIVSLKAEKLAELLRRARPYRGVMLAHNHLGDAFISPTDEVGIRKFAPRLADFRHDACWVQLVAGRDGIFARLGDAGGMTDRSQPLDRIKIIGTNGIRLLTPLNSRLRDERVQVDEARHNRTLNLLGRAATRRWN